MPTDVDNLDVYGIANATQLNFEKQSLGKYDTSTISLVNFSKGASSEAYLNHFYLIMLTEKNCRINSLLEEFVKAESWLLLIIVYTTN